MTFLHLVSNLNVHNGVWGGDLWACSYCTLESIRHTALVSQLPYCLCMMDSMWTAFVLLLKVSAKKLVRRWRKDNGFRYKIERLRA